MALTREWLLVDSPSSRLQARLGRSYRVGRALLANPLAVLGALIVLVLIGMALFAPWIATHSATGQNLSMRLMPLVVLSQSAPRRSSSTCAILLLSRPSFAS